MPWSNVPKRLWGKMERCVNDIHGTNKRTGKSYTKSEKTAICYSQIVEGGKSKNFKKSIAGQK